jgi:tetratricopeptide (TPR) repeat protein
MKTHRIILASMILVAILSGPVYGVEPASKDQELFNQGKIAIFDKDWDGARAIFQRVIQQYPKSPVVSQAYYFIARCYQFQGKDTEAIQSYERFLQLYPTEPFLSGEARTAVVELAASLLEKGDTEYRNRLVAAMGDSRKDIRYFAALRCSRLKDGSIQSLAAPVLKEIVRSESEKELVDRARIALLRIDPKGLSPNAEAPEPSPKSEKAVKPGKAADVRMFHLVVYKAGSTKPAVELNVPVSLAQLAIAALDESTKAEIRKKGVDIDNVWESLKKMGSANILTLRDGENLVKLWIQ